LSGFGRGFPPERAIQRYLEEIFPFKGWYAFCTIDDCFQSDWGLPELFLRKAGRGAPDLTKEREMETHLRWKKRGYLGIIAIILFLGSDGGAWSQTLLGKEKDVGRGEYLIIITGCNDCHTPGFAESDGSLPRGDWLTGSRVGWRGPWGTTYPSNLRIYMADISEEGWVKKSRLLKTRPPMPWWVLHTLKDEDSRAMYRFIRNLGRKAQVAPSHVPANQEPTTPYILFVPQPPKR
jgi:mono/diheme cytochrome c family protein